MLVIVVKKMLLFESVDVIPLGVATADVVRIIAEGMVLGVELEVNVVREVVAKSEVNDGVALKAQVKGWLS